MKAITHIILSFCLLTTLSVQAQSFHNAFEDGNEWLAPWINLHIIADSCAIEGSNICLCDSVHEYGLGFKFSDLDGRNLHCQYDFLFRAETPTIEANFVVSIVNGNQARYWNSFPLSSFESEHSGWTKAHFDLHLPADYLTGSQLICYIWNPTHNRIKIDQAHLEIAAEQQCNHIPHLDFTSLSITPFVEYIDAKGDTLTDLAILNSSEQVTLNDDGKMTISTKATFNNDIKLLRLAYLMPLPEGNLTVYRRNQQVDTSNFQNAYYLDREGFMLEDGNQIIATYHNNGISSLQLDAENHLACFNIDYWRDHPLIHYPLIDDTLDYFQDISYRTIHKGDVLEGKFTIFHPQNATDLPRIMPVWDGYESAFIFTEHADWTDISTHRAVLFGNENITNPEDAVGGFTYFDIPVTKSVFYNNPDHITNAKNVGSQFKSSIETIKTDKDFLKLLKSLKDKGFDICLHTPSIYSTTKHDLKKSLRFMQKNFGSPTWIDHGYNNTKIHNREDLVCDALLPDSPLNAAELWKKYGIHYLWNAYYEENRMEDYHFDANFVQPYDGFGDALPNRQITTLPDENSFLLWSTSSTLEVNEDKTWYYLFDTERLQRLASHHNVFIAHTYPAWSDPWRGFWQYNENGTAVAMPGFNFALQQLATFRDEKRILTTTIQEYLSFYEKLLNLEYTILPDGSITLTNHGETIKGLTLICPDLLIVEGKHIDSRKVGGEYLMWFNIEKNETVNIKHRQ